MFRQRLAAEFRPFAELSHTQLDQLEAHRVLLEVWNRKMNLIRFKDLEELIQLHYCESLFLGLELGSGRVADVGSGAGFPGIPVAILRPDLNVTLIERDQRKAVFLREATRELRNTQVLAQDAATVTDRFDWVVSRAVSPEEVLRLRLAPNWALLTAQHAELQSPWGHHRFVSRGTIK